MFGSSTQLSSWTFRSDRDVDELRREANQNYIDQHGSSEEPERLQSHFLNPAEELILLREFVRRLRAFCRDYRDPRDNRVRMPPSVSTTATHYLLRYYLYNSVMDYHPRDIMHTCIYLACKVEEFYVTISDYVHNLTGTETEKMQTVTAILNSELQTTQELQFHLIVHQPYRPVEGLLIDLKTRYPRLRDPETLRAAVDEFLERAHHTDAPLLYSPSQLALAAVTTAASKTGQNLDTYVTDTLFAQAPDRLAALIDAVRKIKRFVKNSDNVASAQQLAEVERKLALCLNPVHDPTTEEYRINQARLEQEDEDFPLTSSTAAGGDGDEGVVVLDGDA